MAVQCRVCGAVLSGDEKFCGSCGAAIVVAAPQAATPIAAAPINQVQSDAYVSSAATKPTGGNRPFRAWLATGLMLSVCVFMADLIAVFSHRSLTDVVTVILAKARMYDFEIIVLVDHLSPWLVVSLLAAVFTAVASNSLWRPNNNLVPRPFKTAAAGAVTGLIVVTAIVLIVSKHHYYFQRLETEAVPLGIISLIAGFGVAAVLQMWFQPGSRL